MGALIAMGAIRSGMKEEELQPLVASWRMANPHIVQLWWDLENTAKEVIRTKQSDTIHGLTFSIEKGIMFIKLPSGRRLAYVGPGFGVNRFGSEAITYWGTGTARKWEKLETFGGKLTENIVQAIARDLLCEAMQRLRHMDIVMHVHDEVIIEAPLGKYSVDEVCRIMSELPHWANGLVLDADGYECSFYMKD